MESVKSVKYSAKLLQDTKKDTQVISIKQDTIIVINILWDLTGNLQGFPGKG